jgi:hypothetical protein
MSGMAFFSGTAGSGGAGSVLGNFDSKADGSWSVTRRVFLVSLELLRRSPLVEVGVEDMLKLGGVLSEGTRFEL